MQGKSRIFNLIIAVVLVLFLGGCVTVYNPATGRHESLLIDTKSEVSIGRDMDIELKRQMKFSNDLFMDERLQRIGEKVAAASDRQDLEYHFKVIENKELNAFTTPGGFIYVNSGLMERANDDELACVLAHEIGHVAARHTVKKMQTAMGYSILMGIASGVNTQQSMLQAVDIVFNLASLGYGRKDEELADKLAVRYARRSGFSPYGMVTFFQKLKKDADRSGRQAPLVFLSSHPAIDERIKNVEKEIRNYH